MGYLRAATFNGKSGDPLPAFSIINQYGGKTFAVYKPGKMDQFVQANRLQQENRVQGIGEANYNAGSLAAFWITDAVNGIRFSHGAGKTSRPKRKGGPHVPTHPLRHWRGYRRKCTSRSSRASNSEKTKCVRASARS